MRHLRKRRLILVGTVAAILIASLASIVAIRGGTAEAQIAPASDHYLSYTIRSKTEFVPLTVDLRDQFTSRKYDVTGRLRLLNPARKNDSGVNNGRLHYQAYKIALTKGQELVPSVNELLITNQFGGFLVKTGRPVAMLVPTAKAIRDRPDPLTAPYNHYLCYNIKTRAFYPQPPLGSHFGNPFIEVEDQFLQAKVVRVFRPVWLCNPAAKTREDGEVSDIVDPNTHLMCFSIDEAVGEPPHERVGRINILNQFEKAKLKTRDHKEFCAPSHKFLPFPDFPIIDIEPGQ